MMTTPTCDTLRARGGWAEGKAAHDCAFPIEPRNTASNAAYAIAGLVLIGLDPSLAGAVLLAALLFLAIGSAAYHGTKRGWGHRLDVAGMYATFGAFAVYGLIPELAYAPALAALAGGLLAYLWAFKLKVGLDAQMGLLVFVALARPALLYQAPAAYLALGLFAAGYLAWQLDRRTSLLGLWGHALWHVLTAAATVPMYLSQGVAR